MSIHRHKHSQHHSQKRSHTLDFIAIAVLALGFIFALYISTSGRDLFSKKTTEITLNEADMIPTKEPTPEPPATPDPNLKNYVAFGDSLTVGTVWSKTPGGETHRVSEDWKIPTRIALALNKGSNYVNMGIGGIGYRKVIKEQNIVDVIKQYDYTNTDIVTIMGGGE